MKSRLVVGVLASCISIVLAQSARASVAPRWSDQELVDLSEVIVRGHVAGISSGWDSAADLIYTYVSVDVSEVVKGSLATGRVVIKQLGGVVGEVGLSVADQPAFTVGEEVLLFLEVRPRDGTLYTSAAWQGKWTVGVDGTTGERVAHRAVGGRATEIESRSYGAFAGQVRAWAAASSTTHGPLSVQPAEAPAPTEGRIVAPFVLIDNATPYRWHEFDSGATLPVDIQSGGQPGLASGGAGQLATAQALWNNAGSAVRLATGSTSGPARCTNQSSPAGRIQISFMDPCGEVSDAGGTLAVGGAWFFFGGANNKTVNGVSFGRASSGFVVNNNSATALNFLQRGRCFQDIQTHEIGHVLGLGHPPAGTDAIMLAFIDNACMNFAAEAPGVEYDGVTGQLGSDDIAGARFIYPGGGAPPPGGPPAAPTGHAAQVNGLNVTLSWNASPGATSYQLEAGTGAGLTNAFNGDVGNTTVLPAQGPAGTFFTRVRAKNAAGTSGPSNEISFTLGGGPGPCQAPPPPPSGLTFSVSGGVVTLNWGASAGATSYLLEAGSGMGLANILVTNVGNTTGLMSPAPPGTYFVRIKAVNACGTGGPSNEVVVVVP